MDFNPKENSMKFRSGWDTIIEPSLITNDTLNDIPLPNDTLNPIQKKLQEWIDCKIKIKPYINKNENGDFKWCGARKELRKISADSYERSRKNTQDA